MLRTDDLDYPLPESLIATRPTEPRDAARLLVVSRSDPARLDHLHVRDLPEVLRPPDKRAAMPHDLMVVNATRVLPARFKGERTDSKGHVEGLYISPSPREGTGGWVHRSHENKERSAVTTPNEPTPNPSLREGDQSAGPLWIVLLKMRRMKPDVTVTLFDRHGRDSGIVLRLIERADDTGAWIVRVESDTLALSPNMTCSDLLEWVGLTPVPPYILAARRKHEEVIADDADRKHYQTVYATDRGERPGYGSVAAPTAGLHFTPALLDRLRDAGVRRAEVTLDVGLGTFKPIEAEFVRQHPMHAEWCSVPQQTALQIASMRASGRGGSGGSDGSSVMRGHESPSRAHIAPPRVIAIGTTAARALESFDSPEDMLRTGSRNTRLLITPGHAWKNVDALMTNFHLPRSTLLAMVAAMLWREGDAPEAAVARLKEVYARAVERGYRFYSYGDAMLILP